MPSSLSWLVHDSKARERTQQILFSFMAKESRDELGLGAIRDSFSDQLFPGTSTIQTRLRYMLFIPWIYRQLEENKKGNAENFATEADRKERELGDVLRNTQDNAGAFGKTKQGLLKRLPSSVYWSGLRTWGIFRQNLSQEGYHRTVKEIYGQRMLRSKKEKEARKRGDDRDAYLSTSLETWHKDLPKIPNNFPKGATFSLSRAEAEFILARLEDSCTTSLLYHLTKDCRKKTATDLDKADTPWTHPDFESFPVEHKKLLHHAKLFSTVMNGAALSYNFQLANMFATNADCKEAHDPETYRKSFQEWAVTQTIPLREEIVVWDLDGLWKLTDGHGHNITASTKEFVGEWVGLVKKALKTKPFTEEALAALLTDQKALALVKNREIACKGKNSRFQNAQALGQWGGWSGTTPLVYRWHHVKVLLADLYVGLNKTQEEVC